MYRIESSRLTMHMGTAFPRDGKRMGIRGRRKSGVATMQMTSSTKDTDRKGYRFSSAPTHRLSSPVFYWGKSLLQRWLLTGYRRCWLLYFESPL